MAYKTDTKPVRTRAPHYHGFFGVPFFKEHMMMDELWEPNSLNQQFQGMNSLLDKNLHFRRLKKQAERKVYQSENKLLKRQLTDGRTKLQLAMFGDNAKKIHNMLLNHKDMQRLYHKMPLEMVKDNINQKTFVLRKERDRMRYKLENMMKEYEDKLLEKANLENRIKYQDEFVLDEEVESRRYRNRIENSAVRLNAIKAINGTYQKMIQVLSHDSIFYDPILRSLDQDMRDQDTFVKHVIALGLPAIKNFEEISEQFRRFEEGVRKKSNLKTRWVNDYKKTNEKDKNKFAEAKAELKEVHLDGVGRYVRETGSMLVLKDELEKIEATIKQVEYATLCSRAKEIYPRMKGHVDDNRLLRRDIAQDTVVDGHLHVKHQRAEVFKTILVNNLSPEEIRRLEEIANLRNAIAEEDQRERDIMKSLKERAVIFVLLRITLWSFNEVFRNVGKPTKPPPRIYPVADLQLPLLTFETMTMRAYPPDNYQEDIKTLLSELKTKAAALMKFFKKEPREGEKNAHRLEYHEHFLKTQEILIHMDSEKDLVEEIDEDEIQEIKTMQNIPTRRQIKAISAKVVEEAAKRDE